jgi:hypothetical protein
MPTELAVKINRLYINVIFNDGKSIDTTGPFGNTAGAAIDKALPSFEITIDVVTITGVRTKIATSFIYFNNWPP